MSKKYEGSHTEILKAIVSEVNSEIGGIKIETGLDTSGSIVRYIAPNVSYKTAVEHILRSSSDPVKNSQIYVFESFSKKSVIISSYNDLIREGATKPYRKYRHASFYSSVDLLSEASQKEQETRILSIESVLGFSNFKGIAEGAYVSMTREIDLSSKLYREEGYNAISQSQSGKALSRIPQGGSNEYLIANDFTIGLNKRSLDAFSDSVIFNVYRNSKAYADSLAETTPKISNIHADEINVGKKRAAVANLEQFTHKLSIHGDPKIYAGAFIDIDIPRTPNNVATNPDLIDKVLSGTYLVVSVIHEYTLEGMKTYLKVKRDTIARSYSTGIFQSVKSNNVLNGTVNEATLDLIADGSANLSTNAFGVSNYSKGISKGIEVSMINYGINVFLAKAFAAVALVRSPTLTRSADKSIFGLESLGEDQTNSNDIEQLVAVLNDQASYREGYSLERLSTATTYEEAIQLISEGLRFVPENTINNTIAAIKELT